MLTRARATALLATAGLSTVITAMPASAADPTDCDYIPGVGQVCRVVANPPSDPGSRTPGSGSSSQKKVTCQWMGQQVDCTSDEGTWSNARQCWVSLVDPQPAQDLPIWEGNTTGAIYKCTPPGNGGGGRLGVPGRSASFFWADSAPARVNPAALAREAVESMNLVAPTVGATPLPKATAVSLIGLPTWLWIADADDRSWGPITRTASAGGVTVTATAKVAKVVWDMGDGNTVTCATKGTEWTPARGVGDSPTCGYRYDRRGQRTITATTYWEVVWSGAGQSGTITFDMSGTRDVNVVELRAVITG
jgi:hypothetical protein